MSQSKLQLAAVLTVALTMLGGGVGIYYAAASGSDAAAQKAKDPPAASKAANEKERANVEAEAKLETVRPKTAKELQVLLQRPSQLQQPVNNVPLKELLESLRDRFEVPIRIDSAAFARRKMPGATAMYDQPVSLPIVRGMSLSDALHEALAQVSPAGAEAVGNGKVVTYRIRDGQILIVPAYIPPYPLASTGGVGVDPGMSVLPTDEIGAQIEGEPVSLSVEETPFSEVLQELRRVTGANIVLDNRQKEKAREAVTATLNDVCLLTALRILGDMCDLKPVELNGVYYVTSRQNAERLQKEINRERFGDPQPPQPGVGGSGLGGPVPVPTTEQSKDKKTKEE